MKSDTSSNDDGRKEGGREGELAADWDNEEGGNSPESVSHPSANLNKWQMIGARRQRRVAWQDMTNTNQNLRSLSWRASVQFAPSISSSLDAPADIEKGTVTGYVEAPP